MKNLILIIIFLFLNAGVFSQDKYLNEMPCELQNHPLRNNNNVKEPNAEQIELQQKLIHAKTYGSTSEVLSLQTQLDRMNGGTSSNNGELIDTKVTIGSNGQIITDNINISMITPNANIKAVTTCTEQRASNIGRIWAVTAYNAGATQSAISLSYSNDGMNWTSYATITYIAGIMITNDEIDAEIVENTTGDKYLYVIFGYKNNGGTGDWRVGVTVINITSIASNSFTLNWPGTSAGDYYYSPRICSDNSQFASGPYIFIISNYDTTTGTFAYRSGAKIAIVYSAFGTNPVFNYRGTTYYGTVQYRRPYYYDLGYYKNGNDSVVVVESSVLDSNSIYIGRSYTGTFLTGNPQVIGSIQTNSYVKTHAYVASNGPFNKLMIVNREKYSALYWDITYYRSSNGAAGWSRGYVDARYVNKSRPDITGVRNSPGIFFCSYSTIDSYDSVFYATTTNYNWNTPVGPKNHISSSLTGGQSRPGFNFAGNDNCFVLWSGNGGSAVYGSIGCTPVTIGIVKNGNNIPVNFGLYQNYPNPFNPYTNIKFDLPKSSNVELRVYDALGRENAVLVNEHLNAGSYTVDFNGSELASGVYFYRIIADDFVQVRKMLIIK